MQVNLVVSNTPLLAKPIYEFINLLFTFIGLCSDFFLLISSPQRSFVFVYGHLGTAKIALSRNQTDRVYCNFGLSSSVVACSQVTGCVVEELFWRC